MISKKSLIVGAAGAALTSFLFVSCKDNPGSDTATGEAKPLAASGGNAVAASAQSAHFAAVNGHLDLGGMLYGYMDVDGDVEKLAGMVQAFLDSAKREAGGDMPPHLKNLNVAKVLEELGLSGIEAMGGSTAKDGAIYRNKGYLHIPGGREGLLKILGGGAAPFASKSLAPADTDLAWELTLDVQAGYEVVSTMVRQVGGPEADQEFQRAVGEMIPQLGLSMNDILTKLNTRVTVIGRLHPDKPLEIPEAPVSIPSFDLVVALDDTGWLFEKIVANLKKEVPEDQQAQMFASGDGFEKVMGPPMPPAPEMVIAQPVIYHDFASKRVLIGSSQAFIDECLANTTNLLDSDAYKKAAEGLPTEGNALSYMSERFSTEMRKLVAEAMKSAPQGGGDPSIPMMMGPMMTLLDGAMPALGQGQAGVIVNLPEGILSVSNAGTSFKEAAMMGGGALAAGALFGVRSTSSMDFPMPTPAFETTEEVNEVIPFEAPPTEEALPVETPEEESGALPTPPDEPQASVRGTLESAAIGAATGGNSGDEFEEEPVDEAATEASSLKTKAAGAISGGGFSPQ